MRVTERMVGDRKTLGERIATEANAKQRDRLRAVALALDGEEAPRIARRVGRTRRFVQEWVYRYRDHGLEGLRAKPQPGAPARLSAQQQAAFQARMRAGPTAADAGLCTLRGPEARRILQQEFGKTYTLSGTYKLLHRLGFSCLKPRPRHRKNDPAAMAQWLADAPLLSRKSSNSIPARPSKSGSRTKPGSASKAP